MKAGYKKQADYCETDVKPASQARPETAFLRSGPQRSSQQSPLQQTSLQSKAPIQPTQGADIYTPDQRQRRDATIWTPVQGVLAALQFVVFLVSLALVLRFILSGDGFFAASLSVCLKTIVLLAIMVTGSLWEKAVFGQYLFAPSFFWEDVVSFGVIALHLLYVAAFAFDLASAQAQMVIALAAYAAYIVNAGQFLWKFRQARRGQNAHAASEAQAQADMRTPPNGALLSSGASRGRAAS